jgi:hypothetical protein
MGFVIRSKDDENYKFAETISIREKNQPRQGISQPTSLENDLNTVVKTLKCSEYRKININDSFA